MPTKYVAPNPILPAFTCPHCETLAPMETGDGSIRGTVLVLDFRVSHCGVCGHCAIWTGADPATLVYPHATTAPPPNEDLPLEIADDYREAANVVGLSPRSAAALLRLCVQKLCVHFGQPGKNINDDIGALVKAQVIRPIVQRAMDIVRIAGNESVHPGEINLDDDAELVASLFDFVNLIAEEAITQPAKVDGMYERIPESKRNAVAKRDGDAVPTTG